MADRPINVTEPFLPPLEEYIDYLKGIWERNWLTNQGPLLKDLEEKLRDYHQIGLPVHCVANGGLGLQIILKAMGVGGEIITTPFTYVATASCPLWEGCSLRFADIDPDHLTIDPAAVEAAITPRTEAILGTHVFGNPCDCDELERIARRHGLALIYDAAHAFGVRYKEKSILEYGDASMVSLHATKLMHSVEGGFIVAKDPAVSGKVEWMRRFGHKGYEDFHGVGTNAKMSEFHAAMGLCCLSHIEDILKKRKAICEAYDQALGLGAGGGEQGAGGREANALPPATGLLSTVFWRGRASRNYAYYPVIFDHEDLLLETLERFRAGNIYPRRYFWPSLDEVEALQAPGAQPEAPRPTPHAQSISRRIFCLPLSASMEADQLLRIIHLVNWSPQPHTPGPMLPTPCSNPSNAHAPQRP
ncbi:MAG: DegT/DnrJ/EryC1/StrS family aminotransferase [Verrucomicrobiota bacterium]